VKVEVQVAEAVVPARVQIVNVPVTPVSVSDTVPAGVVGVAEVSVTVIVHVDPWLITTGVAQLIVVVVWRTGTLTTMLAVPLLKL
jgi:hypothetical protein